MNLHDALRDGRRARHSETQCTQPAQRARHRMEEALVAAVLLGDQKLEEKSSAVDLGHDHANLQQREDALRHRQRRLWVDDVCVEARRGAVPHEAEAVAFWNGGERRATFVARPPDCLFVLPNKAMPAHIHDSAALHGEARAFGIDRETCIRLAECCDLFRLKQGAGSAGVRRPRLISQQIQHPSTVSRLPSTRPRQEQTATQTAGHKRWEQARLASRPMSAM